MCIISRDVIIYVANEMKIYMHFQEWNGIISVT